MSYSQLILSESPYGYWDLSSISIADVYSDLYTDEFGVESILDLTPFGNNADPSNAILGESKGILPNITYASKFDNISSIDITNTYNLFLSGAEQNDATVELFFTIKDSSLTEPHHLVTIGNFLECYVLSDKIFVESQGQKVFISVPTWDNSNYLALVYQNRLLTMYINDRDPVSIQFENSFIFPDSSAPPLSLGPSANANLDMYINALAVYTYPISTEQIQRRLNWSQLLSSQRGYSSIYNSDYFDIFPTSITPIEKIKITSDTNFNNSVLENLYYLDDTLYLKSVDNLQPTDANYLLDSTGISFTNDCFIQIDNFMDITGGQNLTIRSQAKIESQTQEQTILQFGPLSGYLYFRLYWASDGTVKASRSNYLDIEEVILESSVVSDISDYLDIAVNIDNGLLKIYVDGEEIVYGELFSQIDNLSYISIGNMVSGNSPFLGRIKNFTIDKFTEFSDIDFTEVGFYTAKFNNSLGVSQVGRWSFSYTPDVSTVGSLVTFNSASKNVALEVNGSQIYESSIIPSYNNESPQAVTFDAVITTDDSENDIPILNDIFIVLYQDMYISSHQGKYSIETLPPGASDTYPICNPYITREYLVNPISKPNNLGIKFVPSETTGAVILKNSDDANDDISDLELIFKIDALPTGSTVYQIIDTDGLVGDGVYIDSSGLNISGSSSIYLDGLLVSGSTSIMVDEFYHLFINFDTPISSEIYLGVNNSGQNIVMGSMGGIEIYQTSPSNISQYVLNKYNMYCGRIILSKTETQQVTITDNESPQTYTRTSDGKYFAMNNLPKIKIIENKWQDLASLE